MKNNKVLVTGATGFIGSSLVHKLVDKGYSVRILVRDMNNLKGVEDIRERIEIRYGDITISDSLTGICNDIDIVVHIAGLLGRWGVMNDLYWQVNVNGTKYMLYEVRKANIKRFVYCSTAGVIGPLKNDILPDETYPYNPSNIYEKTKCEAEKFVIEFCTKYGIPMVVVRPEFIYGPGDMHVLGLFKAIKKGIFPLINNGKSTLHPTYIDDLIAGFELCMTHENAVGNVYFIAGERKVSVKELSESMAEVMNVAVPKIYVPEWLIRIGAHILEPMCKYMNIEPPVTHAKINFFTQSRGVSIQKANKELGYVPQTGLKQGLIKTVTWYKDNGYL